MSGARVWGATSPVQEPGFEAQQDDRGAWTATARYTLQTSSFGDADMRNLFTAGASPLDFNVNLDTYWAFLGLYRAKVVHQEHGKTIIQAWFSGFSSSTGGGAGPATEAPQYYLRGLTYDRDILEHPEVVDLGQAAISLLREIIDGSLDWSFDGTNVQYRDPMDGDTLKTLVDQPTGDALTWTKKILAGLRTYKAATYKWVKRWSSETGLTTSNLNGLGKTATPDGGAPTATGSRTWMLSGAYQSNRGPRFDNQLEWTLSERGGWDTDIYNFS